MGRVLLRASFIRGTDVAPLLDDACRVIEGTAGDVALLRCRAVCALDVEDETVSGELLAASYLDDVARLDVGPGNGHESFEFDGDH
tara:strand:- start:938 stop:1195 length:258 start_codon:yes stop_codon:yes gene_type:complete